MMDLINESGWGAWVVFFFALAGVAATLTVGRRVKRPGSIAAAFAVGVLAAGAIGFASGQRAVERYVNHKVPAEDLALRLEHLTVGTREATSNLALAGLCALVLMSVGGGLALRQGKLP